MGVPDVAVFFESAVQEMAGGEVNGEPGRGGAGAELGVQFHGWDPTAVAELEDGGANSSALRIPI